MTTIRIIIVFVIGVLLIVLALQNAIPVEKVKVFYREYYNIPLAVVMLYAYLFGLVTAGIFWLVNEIKLRSQLRKQKKENEALMSELVALRNLPLDIKPEKEQK
ncbi:MAG: LapA family protein [candidate division WOR-3 bacterium]|nr:LapA family protein [candidate division WOR-3 bacterium]